MRALLALLLLILIAAGSIFFISRRETAPLVTIEQPGRVIGQNATLAVSAETPDRKFTQFDVTLEQNGQVTKLFSLDGGALVDSGPNTVRYTRPIGRQAIPSLRSGTAKITVTATRKAFLNLRTLTTTATKDVQVRLEPPRLAVLSTHHYVNHGGSEMVVYRVTPDDVASGVRVGDVEYLGIPVAGAREAGLRLAFFALLYDQDLNTPINPFARDVAGNKATAAVIDNVVVEP